VNPMILGYAWQKGWIPLAYDSLMRAVELNAVAVDQNKAAFAWGRRAAADPASMDKLLAGAGANVQVIDFKKRETLEHLVARRVEFLTGYQNAAYAADYQAFVEKVKAREQAMGTPKHLPLTEAVARYLFKLMAYKDEYEVARLHTDPAFHAKITSMFEGEYTLNYHLAPPLTSKKNAKGELQKSKFGPSMLTGFKLLAKLKGLRGTALDVFGRTDERKTERALIVEYRASLEEVLAGLNAANHGIALDIARIPEQIKGYGHVKERNVLAARQKWAQLQAAFRTPAALAQAA
jgi:indolepyruvate ferredoxin oxidoreductase